MKKFYALMALATTLTASAAVLPVTKNLETVSKENSAVRVENYTNVENDGMFKAPAVGDVNNYYTFTYWGMTNKDNSERQYYTVQIKKVSATEVEIYGIFSPVGDFTVKATYNASAQTLTIAPQTIVADASSFGVNGAIKLFTRRLVVDGDNKITNTLDIPEIVFTYCPDGVQMSDGSIAYIGGWLPETSYDQFVINTDVDSDSGWIGSWKYSMAFAALEDRFPEAPAFTFNESEWSPLGKSSFNDGWFGILSNTGSFPAYDVETYVNNDDENVYLLKNPYGQGSPYADINTYKQDGYLILDVTNPDCVLVRPNVNPGFVAEDYTGCPSNISLSTYESDLYYVQGWTCDEILEEAEYYEDEVANIDSDRVVTLPTCRLLIIPDFANPNYWIDKDKQPMTMRTTIKLAALSGVDGIINDADNTVKRYFNLQGLEIASPEADQIVIVKEGNKATKTIVK